MNCTYCQQPAEFVSHEAIYGKRYGDKSWMVWLCRPCNAYVGVHQNNPARPLGTMANKELRAWRQKAHAAIDPLWESGLMKRKAVYARLSEMMGYEVHVGESNAKQCAAIIEAAKQIETELTGGSANAAWYAEDIYDRFGSELT